MIIVGGTFGDTLAKPVAAALDPQTGSWRPLPALDKVTGLMPSPGVAWDGDEVFVMVSVCAQSNVSCSATLLGYNPATDALRKIDLTKAPIAPRAAAEVDRREWQRPRVLDGRVGEPEDLHRPLRPEHGQLEQEGRPCSVSRPGRGVHETAWLGDRYAAADGSSGLQIYSLDSDAWETITPGPSPLNSREGSAIVWTGADLIAWSGTVYEPFNPPQPTAPHSLCEVDHRAVLWPQKCGT